MKFVYVLSIYLVLCSPASFSEPLRALFINPGFNTANPTGNFWFKVSAFMDAAAEDLNIKLTTLYAERNHIYMRSLISEVQKYQPDVLILVNEKRAGVGMLKQLDVDIPVFFLLNKLAQKEKQLLSKAKQAQLIGSVVPDNDKAGAKLALSLIKKHTQLTSQPVHVFALLGDYATQAALDRSKGLYNIIQANSDKVASFHSVVANWSRDIGYQQTRAILLRNKKVDVVWAANDPMAFGAKSAALSLNRSLLIGGVNWDMESEDNALDISFGGHMTLGAYALVLIKDWLVSGQKEQTTDLVVDIFRQDGTDTSQALKQLIRSNKLSKIDFTRFSYASTARLDFTPENLALASRHK
mgnify:CR=1 FL=1